MDETFQRIEVDVPRSRLIILRKLFNGADVKETIQRCIETFTHGWQAGVEISKEAVLEISSLLNVGTFNSEASLMEAIRRRLKLGPSTVVLEIDGMLAASIQGVAKGNGITFNQCVQNCLQAAFANGVMFQDAGLRSLFFSQAQWDRMRAAMGSVMTTGENVARLIEEGKHLKGTLPTPTECCLEKDGQIRK